MFQAFTLVAQGQPPNSVNKSLQYNVTCVTCYSGGKKRRSSVWSQMVIKGSTNMGLEGKERKEKVRLRENGSITW